MSTPNKKDYKRGLNRGGGAWMEPSAMDPYMDCFFETFGFYPDAEYAQEKRKWTVEATHNAQYPPHYVCRVRYPETWYQPTSRFEKGMDRISEWTMLRYSPYKRISHFREHLNRLQFCQFVTIPKEVAALVQSVVTQSSLEDSVYTTVKGALKAQGYSHYNEHIHHLISQTTRQYMDIAYEDRQWMCQLFVQLEHVFSTSSRDVGVQRKNFFSYYLIVQLVLYLFHVHPLYYLPTLVDNGKRRSYYVFLLTLLSRTPLYEQILSLHFRRKKQCQACVTGVPLFDADVIALL